MVKMESKLGFKAWPTSLVSTKLQKTLKLGQTLTLNFLIFVDKHAAENLE